MTFGDFLKAVLTTRKVWEAFFSLIGAILFVVRPDFPPEVWAAFLVLAGLVLGSVGVVEAKAKALHAVEMRKFRNLRETMSLTGV